jgi:hypothetical protein
MTQGTSFFFFVYLSFAFCHHFIATIRLTLMLPDGCSAQTAATHLLFIIATILLTLVAV